MSVSLSTSKNLPSRASGKKPNTVIVCGPSGVGKGSVLKRLTSTNVESTGDNSPCYDKRLKPIVSYTTRAPRPGEKDSLHYHFVTRDYFKDIIKKGGFLEFAEFSGNLYGTPIPDFKALQKQNKIPLLEIELEGLLNIIHNPKLNPLVFLITPDNHLLKKLTLPETGLSQPLEFDQSELNLEQKLQIIKYRLQNRKDTSPESIEQRSDQARTEMAAWFNSKLLSELSELKPHCEKTKLIAKLLEDKLPLARWNNFITVPSITSSKEAEPRIRKHAMEYAAVYIYRVLQMYFPQEQELKKELITYKFMRQLLR
ncbi:MAG: hypothetical protein OHK0017_05550 [Patescibacteria group bacterium]